MVERVVRGFAGERLMAARDQRGFRELLHVRDPAGVAAGILPARRRQLFRRSWDNLSERRLPLPPSETIRAGPPETLPAG